jgi:hypothetical protein
LCLLVTVLKGKLSEVEALRDLTVELESQKAKLYELLLEEVHKQIYVKSSSHPKKKMKVVSQENLVTSSSPLPVRKVSALAAQKGLTHKRVGSGEHGDVHVFWKVWIGLDITYWLVFLRSWSIGSTRASVRREWTP